MRIDGDDIQPVDLKELGGFGHGGSCHAGELCVVSEIVLEGDRSQRLVFVVNRHGFFGFDGLMQSVGIASSLHDSPCEFVDDEDLSILDDVVGIFVEEVSRFERLGDLVDEGNVVEVVERSFGDKPFLADEVFANLRAFFGQRDASLFLVLFVVFGFERRDEAVDVIVGFDIALRGA